MRNLQEQVKKAFCYQKILNKRSLPRISKVFLDHLNNFFSQQFRTILVTKYHLQNQYTEQSLFSGETRDILLRQSSICAHLVKSYMMYLSRLKLSNHTVKYCTKQFCLKYSGGKSKHFWARIFCEILPIHTIVYSFKRSFLYPV